MLTFAKLRENNVTRCEEDIGHKLNEWSPSDWSNAMAGECGEACNVVKKLRRIKEKPEDNFAGYKYHFDFTYEDGVEELKDELGDLICYADLLAARMGFTLEDAVRDKFNKVSDKYFSKMKL